MEEANIAGTKFPHYCPSNACMNVFPDNKPQHYKIQLEHPYHLSGNWQVALHSIAYPNNWFNIKETKFGVYIQTTITAPHSKIYVESTFPKGQYKSINELLEKLNSHLNDLVKTNSEKVGATFAYTFSANKNYFQFKETESLPKKIKLQAEYENNSIETLQNAGLFGILGFDNTTQLSLKDGTKAKFQAALGLHFPCLYVYAPNLIQGVGVGETMAPLLATVPITGKIGEIAFVEPSNLVFIDLIQNYIKMIEIVIKDDRGEDVDFIAGKVNILLLFRRIS